MPGREFDVAADTVILAVGQAASAPATAAAREANGTLRARPDDLGTSVPGIFAGGDAVTGPSSIIVAIAQGRTAAAAIDRHLGGNGDLLRFASARPATELHEGAPRGSISTCRHTSRWRDGWRASRWSSRRSTRTLPSPRRAAACRATFSPTTCRSTPRCARTAATATKSAGSTSSPLGRLPRQRLPAVPRRARRALHRLPALHLHLPGLRDQRARPARAGARRDRRFVGQRRGEERAAATTSRGNERWATWSARTSTENWAARSTA